MPEETPPKKVLTAKCPVCAGRIIIPRSWDQAEGKCPSCKARLTLNDRIIRRLNELRRQPEQE